VQEKSERFLAKYDVGKYSERVDRWMTRESALVNQCMAAATEPKVIGILLDLRALILTVTKQK
jgi:hypothetical protein